jgi:hypothetical protein
MKATGVLPVVARIRHGLPDRFFADTTSALSVGTKKSDAEAVALGASRAPGTVEQIGLRR